MEDVVYSDIKPVVMSFMDHLMKWYIGPLYHYVKNNPELIKTVPGFLLSPEQITVYVGRTHIAIEYSGPEVLNELKLLEKIELRCVDYSTEDCNLFEKIIGFEFDSTVTMPLTMPLPPFSEDLVFPTNRGFDKLSELKWNFLSQNSIIGFNCPTPSAIPGQFTRIVNGMFFDANETGLITRRIKWLDLIPIHFDGSDDVKDTIKINFNIYKNLIESDAHYKYPIPDDYKFSQLPKINRFIELWGNKETSEPEVTSHLDKEENKFILTMKFGAIDAHSELTCEWQSEDRNDIRPDFFIVQPNGYADIVEFKLPEIDKNFIVGTSNRETFSAWLNSYIAQTRVYATYFESPNNWTMVRGKIRL